MIAIVLPAAGAAILIGIVATFVFEALRIRRARARIHEASSDQS